MQVAIFASQAVSLFYISRFCFISSRTFEAFLLLLPAILYIDLYSCRSLHYSNLATDQLWRGSRGFPSEISIKHFLDRNHDLVASHI